MNMLLGILKISLILLLAFGLSILSLMLIYLILNFTYKLFFAFGKPINPTHEQGYKARPECNATSKPNKVKDFINGFLFFWSPFKIHIGRVPATQVVNNRDKPCEYGGEKDTFNNTPQIFRQKMVKCLPHIAGIIKRRKPKCNQKQIKPW